MVAGTSKRHGNSVFNENPRLTEHPTPFFLKLPFLEVKSVISFLKCESRLRETAANQMKLYSVLSRIFFYRAGKGHTH